ncbi:MAG: SsrA-binding protein SmpB [Waddliaceae bacterium]|jgi:SsrA-binding protein|nr:SsrA-binding protein SmpB [Waddliaceae bacterium]MBT3579242.1 SsrA-binding protein SmpB [Waddliaceae bacterium]MBT6928167.1 SsrA-binding protein SmpB [Waddliaceae bacterium]MBT7264499.1 SsrA-binding protein SmpB [Waddliaceae bacterium]MBT7462075.1 SsrA-binding protein SmpB [Waddliaceae bacterium]
MADLVSNRRAYHDYEIVETYEAGIVLQGTEIKSLRDHGGSLQEAYVKVIGNELWLIGANIALYRFGNINNHEERRDRKLLMHSREISRLKAAIKEKGFTLVPLAMYLKKGRVKLKIGRGKGKKKADKRAAIKERDEKRTLQRALKNH